MARRRLDLPLTAMEPLATALRRERWMKAAFALWGLYYLVFVGRAFVTPEHLGVYPIFAAAVRHWWADLPMYVPRDGLDLFRYSPTFAVALSPFGLLPNPVGVALWNLLSLAVLLYGLRVLVHRVSPWRWSAREEGIFLILTWIGTLRGVWSAQSNALLLGLVILGVAALLDRRWWAAGFLLAGPVFIKIWPIALVILVCVRWARPLIPRFLAASLVLAALPFLTRPWGQVLAQYQGFWEVLTRTASLRWHGFRDLWTIWEQIAPVDPAVYSALRALSAALVFGWCLWQASRLPSDRHLATAILAIWATWQLLLGPGTERLTYGLIAPFSSAAILLSFRAVRLRATSVAGWGLAAVLGAGAVERALLPSLSAAPAIQPFGVVVFAIWLALWDWSFPDVTESRRAARWAMTTPANGGGDGPDVAVIVPTYLEAENLPLLVPRIATALESAGVEGEVLVVDDDSPDSTEQVCGELARRHPVRCLVRRGERGLASAVLHGMACSSAPTVVVMDADLSHPPERIPELLAALEDDTVDLVIGSRYVPGGETEEGWGWLRRLNSWGATLLAWPLASVRDPLAGFFAIRRRTLEQAAEIDVLGFKIALELMVKCRCRNMKEIPILFRKRAHGHSKLGLREQWNFLRHLLRLYCFKIADRHRARARQ